MISGKTNFQIPAWSPGRMRPQPRAGGRLKHTSLLGSSPDVMSEYYEQMMGLSLFEARQYAHSIDRAVSASYHTRDNKTAFAGVDVVRDSHWVRDPVSGLMLQSTYLEAASENLCFYSEDFDNWTGTGLRTNVSADAIAATVMGVRLSLLGDIDSTNQSRWTRAITLTQNGIHFVGVFAKQGTSPAAAGWRISTFSTNGGNVNWMVGTVTWAAGVPVVVMQVGAYVGYVAFGNGTYWMMFRTTPMLAANTNFVRLAPAGPVNSQQGNVYIGGVMVADTDRLHSYIKTTTASISVPSDEFIANFPVSMQSMTILQEHVEFETILAGEIRLVTYGLTLTDGAIGANKFKGAVKSTATGEIIGIPRDAQQVLVITPTEDGGVTPTSARLVSGGLAAITDKFDGGVEGDDLKIYGGPFREENIFQYDPVTEIVVLDDFGAVLVDSNIRWNGLVKSMRTRKIYIAPTDAATALVIETPPHVPATVASLVTFPGLTGMTDAAKWRHFIDCDQYLIAVPSAAHDILVWDIENDTYVRNDFGLGAHLATTDVIGQPLYAGGTWCPLNNKVYFNPQYSTSFFVIDLNTMTATLETFGMTLTGLNGFRSSYWKADMGVIVFVPASDNRIILLDPLAERAWSDAFDAILPGDNAVRSEAEAENGIAYAVPFAGEQIWEIDFTVPAPERELFVVGSRTTGGIRFVHDGQIRAEVINATGDIIGSSKIPGLPPFAKDKVLLRLVLTPTTVQLHQTVNEGVETSGPLDPLTEALPDFGADEIVHNDGSSNNVAQRSFLRISDGARSLSWMLNRRGSLYDYMADGDSVLWSVSSSTDGNQYVMLRLTRDQMLILSASNAAGTVITDTVGPVTDPDVLTLIVDNGDVDVLAGGAVILNLTLAGDFSDLDRESWGVLRLPDGNLHPADGVVSGFAATTTMRAIDVTRLTTYLRRIV